MLFLLLISYLICNTSSSAFQFLLKTALILSCILWIKVKGENKFHNVQYFLLPAFHSPSSVLGCGLRKVFSMKFELFNPFQRNSDVISPTVCFLMYFNCSHFLDWKDPSDSFPNDLIMENYTNLFWNWIIDQVWLWRYAFPLLNIWICMHNSSSGRHLVLLYELQNSQDTFNHFLWGVIISCQEIIIYSLRAEINDVLASKLCSKINVIIGFLGK